MSRGDTEVTLTSFATLSFLLVLGQYVRAKVPILQRLFLPTTVIAGVIGLVVYQVLLRAHDKSKQFVEDVTVGWDALPGIMINIVFASLFLGVRLPHPKQIWNEAGPQLAYGMGVVWGQWMVGCILTISTLMPIWGVNKMMATTLPIGFAGGHGTAAGMREQYEKAGWKEGADFGLFAATVGILAAVGFGIIFINWAARTGRMHQHSGVGRMSLQPSVIPVSERLKAGLVTVPIDSVDTLTLHMAVIGIAVLFGVFLKWLLVNVLEKNVSALEEMELIDGLPYFPFCMLGGLLVQNVFQRIAPDNCPIDRDLTERLSSLTLEYLICAAIAVVDIDALADEIVPFLILMVVGILWQVFCLLCIAPHIFKPDDHPFERGIAELGSAMGIIATGLLMIRMCDPSSETPVLKAFVYKNAVQALFMGGGLWTATGVMLTRVAGPYIVTIVVTVVTLSWFALGFYLKHNGSTSSDFTELDSATPVSEGTNFKSDANPLIIKQNISYNS
ncbi:hypothetical protein DIPPA_32058 [Diplonema papillatum]|nr:hypothetical protein DIPPA_32058 [Diplonema papillatum]